MKRAIEQCGRREILLYNRRYQRLHIMRGSLHGYVSPGGPHLSCRANMFTVKGSPLRKHCHERLARGVSGDDHELGPNERFYDHCRNVRVQRRRHRSFVASSDFPGGLLKSFD